MLLYAHGFMNYMYYIICKKTRNLYLLPGLQHNFVLADLVWELLQLVLYTHVSPVRELVCDWS